MSTLQIRNATPADCDVINEIYNHYVSGSTCTFQTEPSTIDERIDWLKDHGDAYPVIVAEIDGVVLGWASLSKFHPRAAYDRTVENSVYVRSNTHRHGVGRLLMTTLIGRARALGYHCIVAIIAAEQDASLALHASLGFKEAGILKEVGFKFGRWLDVAHYQLLLTDNAQKWTGE